MWSVTAARGASGFRRIWPSRRFQKYSSCIPMTSWPLTIPKSRDSREGSFGTTRYRRSAKITLAGLDPEVEDPIHFEDNTRPPAR